MKRREETKVKQIARLKEANLSMQKTINEKDRQMKIIKNEMKQKSIKAAKERLQLAEKLKNVKISLEGKLKTQETKIKAQKSSFKMEMKGNIYEMNRVPFSKEIK